MRKYLGRFQFRGAWGDLRYFFGQRQPHQIGFFCLAIGSAAAILGAFVIDSRFEPEYHRDIVYVEQWPASRTDAQIIAQQKIDAPIKARRLAAEKREADKRRESFRKVQDALDRWDLR